MPNSLFYYEEIEKDFFLLSLNPEQLKAYTVTRVPQMDLAVFDFIFDLYLRMLHDIIYRRMHESIIIGNGADDIINPLNFYQWAFEFMPYLYQMNLNISNSFDFSVDPYLKSENRVGQVYSRSNCCIIPTIISRTIQRWDTFKAINVVRGEIICNNIAYGINPIDKAVYPYNVKGFKQAIKYLRKYRHWVVTTECNKRNVIKAFRGHRDDIANPLLDIYVEGFRLRDFINVYDITVYLKLYNFSSNFDLINYLSH